MRSLQILSVTALASVASILSPIAPVVAQQPVKRPNIVLIMADDLGYSDVGDFVKNNIVDGTDVGRDQRATVSDRYASPFPFTGKLKKVTITYDRPASPVGTN